MTDLHQLYVVEGMRIERIGEYLGVSKRKARQMLIDAGIEIRKGNHGRMFKGIPRFFDAQWRRNISDGCKRRHAERRAQQ